MAGKRRRPFMRGRRRYRRRIRGSSKRIAKVALRAIYRQSETKYYHVSNSDQPYLLYEATVLTGWKYTFFPLTGGGFRTSTGPTVSTWGVTTGTGANNRVGSSIYAKGFDLRLQIAPTYNPLAPTATGAIRMVILYSRNNFSTTTGYPTNTYWTNFISYFSNFNKIDTHTYTVVKDCYLQFDDNKGYYPANRSFRMFLRPKFKRRLEYRDTGNIYPDNCSYIVFFVCDTAWMSSMNIYFEYTMSYKDI